MVFSGIADPAAGSIAIEYQQVPCSPPGNMIANVLDNRGAGAWVRFTVEVLHPIVAGWPKPCPMRTLIGELIRVISTPVLALLCVAFAFSAIECMLTNIS